MNFTPRELLMLRGIPMKENKLADLSLEFAVDIIGLVKALKSRHETIISNQIGRSGTRLPYPSVRPSSPDIANFPRSWYDHSKTEMLGGHI